MGVDEGTGGPVTAKELLVFTRQYPTGNGEAFLTHALTVWKRMFERIRVFPMFRGEGELPVPAGVEVVELWPGEAFRPATLGASLAHGGTVYKLFKAHGGGDGTTMRERLSRARQILRRSEVVRDRVLKGHVPGRTALLSVWMEDWVDALGPVLPQVQGASLTCMAHGWDLYEHRRTGGRIPYRDLQLRAIDRIITVSKRGEEHLRERYPMHAHKVRTCHLGTPDHGMAPWSPDPVLRLVSCAYLRPPKRVEVIAEALARMHRPVQWTHFGDGPDRVRLEQVVAGLPRHVSVTLAGSLPNASLIQWYKENPADLFIHLSDSEGGVPLAMQEAIGFGIPVIGNDVGGVNELAGPDTGMLLPALPDAVTLAALLDGDRPGLWRTMAFRSAVRGVWEERFRADVNYARMAGWF